MGLHLASITLDAADPQALAGFWAGVTGYEAETVNEFVAILSGDGSVGRGLMFIKVPRGQNGKEPHARRSRFLGSGRRDGTRSASAPSLVATTSTA